MLLAASELRNTASSPNCSGVTNRLEGCFSPSNSRAASSPLTAPEGCAFSPSYEVEKASGGKEQAGFHEQNQLIRNRWKSVVKDDFACPDDNHFTILDRFADPQSALFKGALKMMGVK